MKQLLSFFAIAAGFAFPATHAASIVENYNFAVGTGIPDGNPAGLADLQTILGSQITQIEEVSVTLDISGGFNGDIYATLQHSSGFAVLLNRVGRTAGNAFGFDDDGFQITLNDFGAFNDVHGESAAGGLLTGTFASDGRAIDPDLVVDTDPRTALLDSMVGLDANGDWTLFVADLSSGEAHVLNSWGMTITGVPEPGVTTLLLLGVAAMLRRRSRK